MRKPAISFEHICSIENLYHAWHKVSLGKSKNAAVIDFYRNLDVNLTIIAETLQSGNYKPGPYNCFLINDPKERIISAPSVVDRVVHHALINHYDPVFDNHLIYDCYACRKNKGTKSAVLRAFHFSKSFLSAPPGYFLKLDVRKYFDSIDHRVLKDALVKIIKDKKALDLFYTIIDPKISVSNKGLPIGNLTSQYFANHYLSAFDHHVKEQLRIKKYIRYMDDMLFFSESKSYLKDLYAVSVSYMRDRLGLVLKPPIISLVEKGAPFLGFLIRPKGIYLQRKLKNRYKSRLLEIDHALKHGLMDETEAGKRIESVTAHLLLARSRKFRNTILSGRVLGD
jgi:retron-type reverse transcriptase